MSKESGGPAFPLYVYAEDNGPAVIMGLTARDYLAAKAIAPLLQGALMSAVIQPTKADLGECLPELAELAYDMADAMLKAREK